MIRKILSLIVLGCFFINSLGVNNLAHANTSLGLPAPGSMVSLSAAYMPVMIKGVRVHPNNPLSFDFILDSGNTNLDIGSSQFKSESQKLIKYFLAALTIKEDNLWVNLSPYEKDHMIPQELGQTEMGRDMLAQDYILKQLTASLIYPEKNLGREFWDKVYAKAQEQFGTSNISVNTFNKVWIVADKAQVLERNNTAYITGAHLKVMLEEDYLALQKHTPTRGHVPEGNVSPSPRPSSSGLSVKASQGESSAHQIASSIIRQIILPQLEEEVNQGENFSQLRQMFYSMILATWYKTELKSALLNQVYSNKAKTSGVLSSDPNIKEKIYQQYLAAYKKGVFNYIKDSETPNGISDATLAKSVPKKYFSGGLMPNLGIDYAMRVMNKFSFGDNLEAKGKLALVAITVAVLGPQLAGVHMPLVTGRREPRGQLPSHQMIGNGRLLKEWQRQTMKLRRDSAMLTPTPEPVKLDPHLMVILSSIFQREGLHSSEDIYDALKGAGFTAVSVNPLEIPPASKRLLLVVLPPIVTQNIYEPEQLWEFIERPAVRAFSIALHSHEDQGEIHFLLVTRKTADQSWERGNFEQNREGFRWNEIELSHEETKQQDVSREIFSKFAWSRERDKGNTLFSRYEKFDVEFVLQAGQDEWNGYSMNDGTYRYDISVKPSDLKDKVYKGYIQVTFKDGDIVDWDDLKKVFVEQHIRWQPWLQSLVLSALLSRLPSHIKAEKTEETLINAIPSEGILHTKETIPDKLMMVKNSLSELLKYVQGLSPEQVRRMALENADFIHRLKFSVWSNKNEQEVLLDSLDFDYTRSDEMYPWKPAKKILKIFDKVHGSDNAMVARKYLDGLGKLDYDSILDRKLNGRAIGLSSQIMHRMIDALLSLDRPLQISHDFSESFRYKRVGVKNVKLSVNDVRVMVNKAIPFDTYLQVHLREKKAQMIRINQEGFENIVASAESFQRTMVHLVSKDRYLARAFVEIIKKELLNRGIDVDKASLAEPPVGGIDLNSRNMGLGITRDGKGIQMKFDPAMIAKFRRGDFTGVEGIILSITPLGSVRPILGL